MAWMVWYASQLYRKRPGSHAMATAAVILA